ncbi:anti-sigma B factor antagonist [Scopulibacillus darangshiensis]|uniref:Anti-sigma factor antagonist n=1 Tax=Scopulibacillus darangshiensis TaxID=442528 RepID=A0A4R2NPW7_9BACL|nr:STAS domain-containing protein [Scopulibacillus darangshiensis]TCP23830.1 anti-sigma B factor antagonist [Scopulibacillus darangshiensis]
MNLNIERAEMNGNRYVLTLHGEVDAFTAPELKNELLPLTEKDHAIVTLDLSGTEYMDSTGLGVIIAGLKSAKQHNSSLEIQGMTPRVERLFQITGLMEILKGDEAVKGEQR